jgi:predicted RecA/RadA family phage recombinase
MERQFNREQRKQNNLEKYGNSLGIKNSTLNILEGVGGVLGSFNTLSESPLTTATNKALSIGLNTTPEGKIVDFARQGISTILKAADLNIDELDKNVVRRQNLSQAANVGNQILAGFGFIPALGKVDKAKILDSKVSSSLSGVAQDADDMQELSNKGLFFGLKKANKRMGEVNSMINKANDLA